MEGWRKRWDSGEKKWEEKDGAESHVVRVGAAFAKIKAGSPGSAKSERQNPCGLPSLGLAGLPGLCWLGCRGCAGWAAQTPATSQEWAGYRVCALIEAREQEGTVGGGRSLGGAGRTMK